LKVIRKGLDLYGVPIHAAFFRPNSGLNPEVLERYNQNILTVTRQVHYSLKNEKSLDMVLSINGLPVVTVELKNQFTGQTVRDAIRQYKVDRDPKELLFQFKKRALVHFAVDPDEVWMTTRLEGNQTDFLPFNRGYENGAGNPPSDDGIRTSYLWQDVWQKDHFMDLFQKFLHLQVDEKVKDGKRVRKERMIFPRYHQWDAVNRILADVLEKGSGHNYLIQHSAGSGKTNTISWLVHRLATLHGADDRPVFDTVIVITDRVVLDRQLQEAIYQFEHQRGIVKQINRNSRQLKEALEKGEARIIISTIQKFGVIHKQVSNLSHKRFAIVVDEAHSSQSGKAANAVKDVLAAGSLEEAEHIQRDQDAKAKDVEDKITEELAKQGPQKNLSYFAFTATPKAKTLELFGRRSEPDGKPVPFHLYSMRQAIEENFILDVLQNYTTYKAYYRLAKAIEDDPEVEEKPAKRAVARFASLHPHNLAQKTEVIVEHFRRNTRHKIGGRAKAMVVTSSRLHALRYKQAFDDYIREKGYTDIQTLVAFSGTVIDKGESFTEPGINGFGENELPERFATDEYQVLIVANKYQTGFDEPLLHTMYVDKKLAGIQAVQTLSRLNRKCPGKEDTFVLDFVNTADEIREAFQPYYEVTMLGEETDLNLIFDLKNRLESFPVIWPDEVQAFVEAFYRGQDVKALHRYTNPAVERWKHLTREEQETFRSTLSAFVRAYGFITQIAPFQSVPTHTLYVYARFLVRKLPGRVGVALEFDEEVALASYRLEETWKGNIQLIKGQPGEVKGITSAGTGQMKDKKVKLSSVIEHFNSLFGTDFTEDDWLFVEQWKSDLTHEDTLMRAARSNTMDNFRLIFEDVFLQKGIERMSSNERLLTHILNHPEAQRMLMEYMLPEVYRKLREEIPQEQGSEEGDPEF
ncbi:MAG: DEAD/DEAH box helicase family protein, partial [Alicyclobacillus sp.]|nr:DEAD/DEAH box helicase family protein [Alicyclobacillus sp.]